MIFSSRYDCFLVNLQHQEVAPVPRCQLKCDAFLLRCFLISETLFIRNGLIINFSLPSYAYCKSSIKAPWSLYNFRHSRMGTNENFSVLSLHTLQIQNTILRVKCRY